MKNKKISSKKLKKIKKRLLNDELSKDDIKLLNSLLKSHIDLRKSVESSSEKIGDKTVIAKLPFGVDLVK